MIKLIGRANLTWLIAYAVCVGRFALTGSTASAFTVVACLIYFQADHFFERRRVQLAASQVDSLQSQISQLTSRMSELSDKTSTLSLAAGMTRKN